MTKMCMGSHLAQASWCGYTPQLFLVVDPESYTIRGKDPLRSWNDWARPRTKSKNLNLQGRRKTTFVHFDRLKPCVISDDKPENTRSREQEPVGTNLDLVDSDDDDPVQQEEAAVPEIANPPAPPLNEQRRYPVRDRQRTQRNGIYVEH